MVRALNFLDEGGFSTHFPVVEASSLISSLQQEVVEYSSSSVSMISITGVPPSGGL